MMSEPDERVRAGQAIESGSQEARKLRRNVFIYFEGDRAEEFLQLLEGAPTCSLKCSCGSTVETRIHPEEKSGNVSGDFVINWRKQHCGAGHKVSRA